MEKSDRKVQGYMYCGECGGMVVVSVFPVKKNVGNRGIRLECSCGKSWTLLEKIEKENNDERSEEPKEEKSA